jgi:hypothetical protein
MGLQHSIENIKTMYKDSGYTLHEVFPSFNNPNKPERYRIIVHQTCPNGHTYKRRWHNKITCGECAKDGLRINNAGQYVRNEETEEMKVSGLILPGVELNRRKGDILVFRYDPKQVSRRFSIIMAVLKTLGIKVEKIREA